MSELLRCETCGGQIVYDVRQQGAGCLFCGSTALHAAPGDDPVPVPDAVLTTLVDDATAEEAYRQWAQASWWRPAELRSLRVKLRPMHLPGWRFRSHVESHWAGLERAGTRSGKRPVTGNDSVDLEHMVPASAGLSADELLQLLPFQEEQEGVWDSAGAHLPYEPPAVSRRAAAPRAHGAMAARHREAIANSHGLLRCNSAPLVDDLDVRLYMLPIYIGAFTYRDRPWRFLVNGQTGEVVGDAPIDRMKVVAVVVSVLAALGAALLFLGN